MHCFPDPPLGCYEAKQFLVEHIQNAALRSGKKHNFSNEEIKIFVNDQRLKAVCFRYQKPYDENLFISPAIIRMAQ